MKGKILSIIKKSVVACVIFSLAVESMAGCGAGNRATGQVQSDVSKGDASEVSADLSKDVNAENGQVSDDLSGNGLGATNLETRRPISSLLDTGNLTATGNGYEGTPGTGKYNYGEALQKSLLFYELQRSGDLPEKVRCNWRGDSCLSDGADVGLDLTGGWFDAGDHVKFNLPMAYSAALLGWSVYEDLDAYRESGQLTYALSNIRWANEYFIKCHPEENVYYYQVGDGGADHSFWGPAEVVELATDRPAYKVTKDSPGSAVTGEAAASLAVAAIVFRDEDPDFSKECLKHAKSLYQFADSTRSDAGYTAANGFYQSWSGYYDELAWAGAWLYLATGEQKYLDNAKSCYTQANDDYDWAMCWDDVHIGAALLLARITEDTTYTKAMEEHLDYWAGLSNPHITYSPKGLAFLDNWGSLRYASTTAFLALLYSRWEGCPKEKVDPYFEFAESQANYILGDTGFSYMIGFGEKYPVRPHHRTAQGSYSNNMNEPGAHRHVLYGALVGGPDASDHYSDDVSNYNNNEVACDYNAGFTGLMASLYAKYHGQTLVDFGAVEQPEAELFVDGGINVQGDDFIEIKALVYNTSAWPARAARDLELRYYVDLSEVYQAGGTAAGLELSGNYMQNGSLGGLKIWDEEKHIYYMSITFPENAVYPGGQSQYKSEIQARLRNPGGVWNNQNDPSFRGMNQNGLSTRTGIALYENGILLCGEEPPKGSRAEEEVTLVSGANAGANGNRNGNGNNSGNSNSSGNQSGSTPNNGQTGGNKVGSKKSENDMIALSINYDNMTTTASSISGTMEVTNKSKNALSLKNLGIEFYFTKDSGKGLNFSCYHAAINSASGGYTGVKGVSAGFTDASKTDADTCCKLVFSDTGTIDENGTLTVNFCINHEDWSTFDVSNDYSVSDAAHIVVTDGGNVIFGTRP